MSLSLKHIPCPAGNKCTAFHCIFGHDNDVAPTQPAPTEDTTTIQAQNQRETSESQDGPRKRLKTDSTPSGITASPLREGSGASASHSSLTSSKTPNSASRPVSSPSLKRKVPSSKQAQSSPSAASKPSTQSKPQNTESLNPRLLKSSPAKHEIRLKLLRLLHAEFARLNGELKKTAKQEDKKLILTDQDLIIRALDEEQEVATQKPAVYPNVMKNKVMQYKRMKDTQWKAELEKEREEAMKKENPDQDSSENPIKIETGLTIAQEVTLLSRLITPVDKLAEHGYVPAIPSDEAIEKARQGVEAAKGWEKCDRCQQRFQVFPGRREEDGALTSGGSCTFHWGKTYIAPKSADGSRQPKRYHCCGQDVGDSAGCFTRDHHVFKTSDSKRLASTLNFAETPDNPLASTDRAVAFDCEMGYTVYGMELIRLTATSWPTGEELLDVLVRPLGEILDLNSRYSGVWPEDLAQAESWTTEDPVAAKSGAEEASEDGEVKPTKKKLKIVSSPEVARDLLFSLISPKTPVIGHGLENDLNSVRIVHPTIIDTILLYPHKAGLPFRYGLKMLMEKHLNRKIQQETGPKMLGHDSAEDARAAGDLVRLKVRNEWMDMQRAGWKLVRDSFIAPGGGTLTEEFIEN